MDPDWSSHHTIRQQGSSPDLGSSAALPNRAEVDVLRNSLSAVMLEYHEESKKSAALAEDHARQSQEIADAAARRAAVEAERDELLLKCSELERRLSDIESSTSWVATRRLREVLTRYPRLRRLLRQFGARERGLSDGI
jgi:septal ring factor EnvC (AmiA/AmiB activator)